MAAVWTPPPAPTQRSTGIKGSASMTSGSVVQPISWLDAQKGETIINNTISTVWDNQPIQCQSVSHTVSPALPAGISIANNIGIGGIVVTGSSSNLLITTLNNNYVDPYGNKGKISSLTLPTNTLLTHYTPLSTKYNDYVISITVVWEFNYDNNQSGSDQQTYILRLWNNWIQEEVDVKSLAATEIK